ncbi:Superfamily I DNA or RNA helicase [Paenibacillus sophorae]|uniref:DNA 3'-5' helicase n=1 Tax=Paenibacillus sophorae TaxID=1333845 RepID=A0A1H8UD31_9BACL|nr:ATP-dependent helicase [Paenibacillus sophorae]QWU13194.1 ATP-dependent helicase [Paenibacillus sophorae]SEP00764.1 Superfamily I DNA or RNA helicase [Paenibacillus sophorae]
MSYTKPENWSPGEEITLEPAAELAVKSELNNLILAGPGAGKTELLAQRACFLLQTNLCPYPQKILAISFKKDAAENLKNRVELRSGKELAARFESRTFDSFSKQLLDRFRLGLPDAYRPAKHYNILTSNREIREIVTGYIIERHPNQPNWMHEINFNVLFRRLSDDELPIFEDGEDIYTWVLTRLWNVMIQGGNGLPSSLTFPMISKLADYLLKQNPLIKKALQVTYSHVFLDEFQDTTHLQYELVKTIFLESSVILTSVGDDKQRIMGWAGALSDSFEQFKHDFNASQIELTHNHRSAPRLIEIQNVMAKIINENATYATVSRQHSDLEGVCEVWNFQTHLDEAVFVASSIAKRIQQENVTPRDICILVKQYEHIYARNVIEELGKQGVQARIEKEYQDLLAEECTQLIIDFFKLATIERTHDSWVRVSEVLSFVQGFDPDHDHLEILKMESELNEHIIQIRSKLDRVVNDEDRCKQEIENIIKGIYSFIGVEKFFRLYPKYARGTFFNQLIDDSVEKLTTAYMKYLNWSDAISDFIGLFSIPIMTIHKSKGLEYDTVIFLGLEDDAFWSFQTQRAADMCAFFVALSRAKKQCFFTFSASREILRFGDVQVRPQFNQNLSSLYQILQDANVTVRHISEVNL